jgi:hypothetical protein
MSFLGLVVLAAALCPLLTRGSYRRLAEAPWRWGALLALGLALQLLLDTDLVSRSRWHDVGFGMLVASYVLLIGFCAGNLLVRGMAVVLIGVALNGFVVTINQGMPVRIPPDWNKGKVDVTVKHHPRVHGDHLLVLTDIITLRRLDAVISFGDLIIAFGLVDATYWASRRARRSRARVSRAEVPTPLDPPDAEMDSESEMEPEPVASSARGNGRSSPVNPNEPRRERVTSGGGRSAPSQETVAIQDALERLERS